MCQAHNHLEQNSRSILTFLLSLSIFFYSFKLLLFLHESNILDGTSHNLQRFYSQWNPPTCFKTHSADKISHRNEEIAFSHDTIGIIGSCIGGNLHDVLILRDCMHLKEVTFDVIYDKDVVQHPWKKG
ncbi:hypothetical protein QL285_047100 [Trifolium repens]|nr:hypothetical protein QL285_047100 [Trifolium repens]